ncbi:O-linked N-acetylglucosamine transferase, SPINDLY family protein [Caldimonas mangrovi]|nr:glycosyltransferase family 41 protein [Caldimonas mangrovi]
MQRHVSPTQPDRERHYLQSRRRAYECVIGGQWQEAERELARLSPDQRFSVQDWVTLASARLNLAQFDGALSAAERALQLEPHNFKAGHVACLALVAQNRWAEALPMFERMAGLGGRQQFKFMLNFGVALTRQSRHEEAVAVLLEAMALEVSNPVVHVRLGLALRGMKLYTEAAESLDTAATLDEHDLSSRLMALHMRQHACDWRRFDAACAALLQGLRTMELEGAERAEGGVFALAALPHPPSAFRQAARHAALLHARGVVPLEGAPAVGAAGCPIRVGYVSNDFHNHATAMLMVGALEARNRERFHVTLYSYGRDDNSAMQQRVRAACDRFVDMRAVSLREMAERIRADGIDILVDLKGHTHDSRIGVFAYRPAPIQVAFLGFPGTCGADYIDYVIGDRWVTPLEHAPHYTEKIAQMPQCYQPNDLQRPFPEPATRGQWGLPADALVLGCFNQAYKIVPETFDSWMRILQAVPDSCLWLLEDNPQATANLRREAEARGVSARRLIFAPKAGFAKHLARLPLADLMLDNWPYNAHTTASDALWMGVPIVTYAGPTFASRVAASLLDAVGLPELICDSPAGYEATAIGLLRDRPRLERLRRHLREGRLHFPVFDGARFAAGLEGLYQRMAERARAGLPPEHLPAAPLN